MYKRLKELRKIKNLTEKDISDVLEISQELYLLYESGKKNIPIHILSKLARYYNTSIDYIVNDTNEIVPYKKNNSI